VEGEEEQEEHDSYPHGRQGRFQLVQWRGEEGGREGGRKNQMKLQGSTLTYIPPSLPPFLPP